MLADPRQQFVSRADLGAVLRWVPARWQLAVDELRPFLRRLAAADATARPEALAAFEAQLALRFAACCAEAQVLLEALAYPQE